MPLLHQAGANCGGGTWRKIKTPETSGAFNQTTANSSWVYFVGDRRFRPSPTSSANRLLHSSKRDEPGVSDPLENKKSAPVTARRFFKNVGPSKRAGGGEKGTVRLLLLFLSSFLSGLFLSHENFFIRERAKKHDISSGRSFSRNFQRPNNSARPRKYSAVAPLRPSSCARVQRHCQLPSARPGELKRASVPSESRSGRVTTARRAGEA